METGKGKQDFREEDAGLRVFRAMKGRMEFVFRRMKMGIIGKTQH